MPQTSFAVMTTLGRAKEAAALANASTITITQIAIGDGATVPSGGETALYHEVARKTISGHGTVAGAANVAYFDCYLAAGDGPYTIREAGLYDDAGDLIAIAHYDPPINKPVPSSGQTVEGTVRLEVAFSDVANVTIVVDPSMQVALQRLTRLPWIPIISMTLATPPVSPVAGDCYLIASAPTGAWTGQAGKIAEYTIAGWAIITPPDGHGVSLPDGRVFVRVSGVYVEKIALDAQSGKWLYAVSGGTANAITVTLAPAPAAYVAGMAIRTKVASTNTASATINVNGLGARQIVRPDGSQLAAGNIAANAILELVYDGSNFQLITAIGQSVLTQNVSIYVDPASGSDTLYDGSSAAVSGTAGPFATLTKALSVVGQFAPGAYGATINLSGGAFNAGAAGFATANWAHCPVTIIGAGRTSTLLDGTAPVILLIEGPNVYSIKGFGVRSTSIYAGGAKVIGTSGGAVLNVIGDIKCNGCATAPLADFLSCTSGLIRVSGAIELAGDIGSTGFGGSFFAARGSGAQIEFYDAAITISTTISCAQFVLGYNAGLISVNSGFPATFVNPANVTGSKYLATTNGIVNTQGRGASYFPGSSAGSTSAGGQYP